MDDVAKAALDMLLVNINTNKPYLATRESDATAELFLKVLQEGKGEPPDMCELQEHLMRVHGLSVGLATSILNIWSAMEIAIGADVRSNWKEDLIEQLEEHLQG